MIVYSLSNYISAAILHGLLQLFGGSRYGFEATLRAVCYSYGAAGLLNVIPACGGCLGLIAMIVLSIIGLARIQEVPTGRAVGAVLAPMALCCMAYVGLIALAISIG